MAARLLYFRADGCVVCHQKAPVVARVARELGLPLDTLDLHQSAQRADELRIRTVPTLALVDGERVRFRLVGRMITPENVHHLVSLSAPPPGG